MTDTTEPHEGATDGLDSATGRLARATGRLDGATDHLDWVRAAPEGEEGPGPWIEIAFGPGEGPEDLVHLRETSDPGTVVTTNRRKWEAFVLGVRAGEFDHFVEGVE